MAAPCRRSFPRTPYPDPSYWRLGGRNTFFVGHLKGVGKVYLQTAVDCHSRYAWGRLYPNTLPVTS